MSMFKRKDPAQLAQQLQQMTGNQGQQADASEWKVTLDNAGNGSAVIRFLPGRTDNSAPFVKIINHGFKGPNNKWYIENCSSTHNDWDNCPVCAYIKEHDLYNTNNAAYQQYKRKTSYWANVLIVKDPSAPENEGKIFKYRFGQKVMDKINGMIQVDTAMGDIPVDVTCPFEGANFSLKVKRVSGHSNYDESRFQNQTQIPKIDDEAVQKKFAEEVHDIDKIVAPDQFGTLADLTKEFNKIIGTAALGTAASQAANQADQLANDLDQFSKEMEIHKDQKVVTTANESDSLDDLMKDL